MLYDKRWDKQETKADPFSLASLIAWLARQNPGERYDWMCQGECMLGQWLKSIDPTSHDDLDGDSFQYIVNGTSRNFSAYSNIALWGEPTFGHALKRALAVSSKQCETQGE